MALMILKNGEIGAIESSDVHVIDINRLAVVEEKRIIEELVIVFDSADKNARQDGIELYRVMNKVIDRAEKIALVITDVHDESAKLLCLLMTRYSRYSIFVVDDLEDADEDYLYSIIEAEPSIDELKEFIGNDIAVYSRAVDVVREIVNSTTRADATIADIVRDNKDNIQSIGGIISALQSAVDAMANMSKSTGGGGVSDRENERNLSEIRRLNTMSMDLQREVSELKAKVERDKNELKTLREFKEEALAKGNSNRGVSDRYISLNADKFINVTEPGRKKPLCKTVLYFKEVTPCRFINSFIVMFLRYIITRYDINCKVAIFDKKVYNNMRYGKLKILDGGTYEKERQAGKLGDIFVCTEVARNVVESLLTENHLVIIYDRFGGMEDIVTGRLVHRYDVTNGEKEITELSRLRAIEKNKIVTNFGVDKKMISVTEIYDYKQMSSGGKLSAYVNMPSTIDVTKTIFSVIMDDCGISKWIDLTGN